MLAYEDEKSKIVFHYDLGVHPNFVEIVVPPDAEGDGTYIAIPFDSVFRFVLHVFGEGLDNRLRAIFARSIVKILNRVYQTDPRAMESLVNYRVICNEKMIEDPTVRTGYRGGYPTLGVMGLLNGLIGTETWIGTKLDGNKKLRGFTVIRRENDDVI